MVMYPQKITTQYRFWIGGFIGPYFFEHEVGEDITVNGESLRTMLTDFRGLKLKDMEVNDMWFLQKGASSHTVEITMDILHELFKGMGISHRDDVNFPGRLYNLTMLEYTSVVS